MLTSIENVARYCSNCSSLFREINARFRACSCFLMSYHMIRWLKNFSNFKYSPGLQIWPLYQRVYGPETCTRFDHFMNFRVACEITKSSILLSVRQPINFSIQLKWLTALMTIHDWWVNRNKVNGRRGWRKLAVAATTSRAEHGGGLRGLKGPRSREFRLESNGSTTSVCFSLIQNVNYCTICAQFCISQQIFRDFF